MTGNTQQLNAVIDLTGGDSASETVETSRGNHVRRPATRSQTRQRALQSLHKNARTPQNSRSNKSDEIMISKATIQSACPVCLRTLEKIKSKRGRFVVTSCGHLFCVSCINMIVKQRRKRDKNDKKYINCPTCRIQVLAQSNDEHGFTNVYL